MLKLPISLLVLKIHDIDTIFVAEENNQIIGICIAQIQDNQLIIERTVIEQEHRRRGISGQLKKAVEEKAKQLGAETSVTKIEPDNKPAIKMATKQGYHTTEQEKIYEKNL